MKFRIKKVSNIPYSEDIFEEIEFNRLDKFIKWAYEQKDPIILNLNPNKTTYPKEIFLYDDWLE